MRSESGFSDSSVGTGCVPTYWFIRLGGEAVAQPARTTTTVIPICRVIQDVGAMATALLSLVGGHPPGGLTLPVECPRHPSART
ncbi:hypothetical protein NSPZN2_100374 [Nitrospira defluvii]|uniref:Uncharacterized protein n=1 Tax=Nitrospira defluvii TaxID=330214 RepID=A0ABM8R432_9BACT|nr:hypothetical protein NSPZN2_100374 [Nitrospira defluvii]